ncbi:hypothetical protein CYMTET_12964 [Cymbomonas tetramitiformis]|uniref:Uncharacterized protein n=1 Tax=Cymbomonas tetramitiformis TaxID=36881 RepID=A0AAE0GJG9_9CHLO|nr:hypothetical protein CYMTET_12964 [Cymbomonas tetramitiformis]
MNEPGEGKDETDSLFNTAKSEVRRQVALGVDATTAVEFIQVLNSKSNITGMIARVVEIFRPDMPFDLGTLDNITRFSHFRFEEGGMRCWEQYKIGPGRLFSNADLTKICKNRPLPATSGATLFSAGPSLQIGHSVGDPNLQATRLPGDGAIVRAGKHTTDRANASRQAKLQKRAEREEVVKAGKEARDQAWLECRTSWLCGVEGCTRRGRPFLLERRMKQHELKCSPPPPPRHGLPLMNLA